MRMEGNVCDTLTQPSVRIERVSRRVVVVVVVVVGAQPDRLPTLVRMPQA